MYLAQVANRLLPTETLFDQFPPSLADHITVMPRWSPVDRAAAAMSNILSHMRRYSQIAHSLHRISYIIPFIRANGSTRTSRQSCEHRQCRLAFGGATRVRRLHVDDEPVTVLHQRVPQVPKHCTRSRRFFIQTRVRVRRRCVGIISPLLPFEIDVSVASVRTTTIVATGVFGAKALVTRPCLDQRSVNGKVLVAKQIGASSTLHRRLEELPANLTFKKPLAVLTERRDVPNWIVHTQPDKPPKEQVIAELLEQHRLASDREKYLQQECPQQFLRRDRRAAPFRVQPCDFGRQLGENLVDDRPDRTQRMVLRDGLLGLKRRPHRRALLIFRPHRPQPHSDMRRLASMIRQKVRQTKTTINHFSQAC